MKNALNKTTRLLKAIRENFLLSEKYGDNLHVMQCLWCSCRNICPSKVLCPILS